MMQSQNALHLFLMGQFMQANCQSHSAFISIIGAPNAGKSTLTNQLVNAKISIVTHKAQTTRTRIRGIRIYDNAQLVFIDTPGIFEPKKPLERAIVSAAWTGAKDGDFLLILIDAKIGLTQANRAIIEKIQHLKQPKILVLNKIDTINKEDLLALTARLQESFTFEKLFMISAATGSGCEDLLRYFSAKAPIGPWYFPEDQLSDIPFDQMAAELTREKLFLRVHEEVPYALTVETESWEQRKDQSILIRQIIYVERASHKKIVIGKNGATLKMIGQAVRTELQMMLGQKVHLFLFVKVRQNWSEKAEHYEQVGLEFFR